VLVAGAAGFVIPGTSLLVPLLAREHHWTAATAGLIVGAQGVGAIAATLCVARRGSASRPGIAAAIGLFVIAAGQLTVGLTAVIPLALTAAAFMGIGSGSFVSNLSPVLLGTAPASHLARIQALLTLVQSGALLATNNALGAIAYGVSATVAMLCCASVLTSCAVVAVLTPAIRRMR
jgi:hypothetical protein